jgi:hypothetical protein
MMRRCSCHGKLLLLLLGLSRHSVASNQWHLSEARSLTSCSYLVIIHTRTQSSEEVNGLAREGVDQHLNIPTADTVLLQTPAGAAQQPQSATQMSTAFSSIDNFLSIGPLAHVGP